jgi:hypothetical protein
VIGRRHLVTATAVLATLATGLLAQYALDHNLQRGSGGYNRPTRTATLSRPVYTVNRHTGGMQYNRANAFNDKSYNIYQRYTHSRQTYFNPNNPGRSAHHSSVTRHRQSAPTGPTRLDRGSYSVSAPRHRAKTDRATTLRRSAPRRSSSAMLSDPRYSTLPTYSRSSS